MPAVIFIPELVEAWVVSILNTGLPLPSWMLTAVVEEIFCVSPPYQETLSNEVPVEEVMLNRFWLVEPPCKVNNPDVVVVPIPTLPLASTVSKVEPVDEEMVRSGDEPALPWRVKVEEVDVVPTDNLRLVLSQLNRLVALKAPAVPANWILPGVPEAKVVWVAPVMVMLPAVVVLMVMLAPATRFVGP